MTNRPALAGLPLLAATGMIAAILGVTAGLPLASRSIDLLTHLLFRGAFYGPALSQLILLALGFTAFGFAVHRTLRHATARGNR